jgi:MoaA/NifB/PqqE/SkfB family radical SAM enzyme
MNNIYPKNIIFYLTEHCPMRCSLCPHSFYHNSDFTTTKFNPEIIKEAAEQAHTFVVQGDGEPLYSDIFLDCIPNIVSDGCEFIFYTSGTMLNEDIIKELIRKNISLISFSIDGGDKKTYTKMRGDYWNILWKNIKYFIKLKKDLYRPVLIADMMICNSNIHSLPLLIKKLIKVKYFRSLLIYRPNKALEKSNWCDGSGEFLFDNELNIDYDKEYKYISESINIAHSSGFKLMANGKFLNHDYKHTQM